MQTISSNGIPTNYIGKVDQDHAIGGNASKVGQWSCIVQTQTVPFQSKAILHRFVFVRAMLGKNVCRPTAWLRLLRRSRKDEPASDWPGQRIDETHFCFRNSLWSGVEKRALSLSLESKFTNEGWV